MNETERRTIKRSSVFTQKVRAINKLILNKEDTEPFKIKNFEEVLP